MAQYVMVSTRKGLFEVKKRSKGWEIASADFLGDNVTLSLHDPRDGATYAALNHGHFGIKLHRRDRGGKWQEIACPKYPAKPEGLNDLDGWGKPVDWSTQLIWALETGGRDEPGMLWAGTMPGGLFRSRDRGDSWDLIRSLWDMPDRNKWLGGGADIPGIHSICVDPRSSKTVRVAVSCGGVWTTHDGGKSWEQNAHGMHFDQGPEGVADNPHTQDPHMMVQCAAKPDRFWVQHHCGIYRSADNARSWQEVKASPSSFGFGVVVHPKDPDTAWFVPGIKDEKRIPVAGALVVTRTRDGGKSFKALKKGLPQQHAYDVVFRHGLALDRTGKRLAMGSTTGNLWVSENQGDSWSKVSSTLPQVYAVRWA
ncbi:MAG: exo-alpha-sialidase [Rhizobiales bacterium]|nr:exo-alpha-sialidase [Hyphomicrobiales bacterium]